MMKLFYSLLLLLLSVSPVRAMEYVNGEPQGGGASIGSYEDVVGLWTDCGSLFMKGDGTCGASSIVEVDPAFSAWDRSTGISITSSQITDITTYLTYADITALWTDCTAGVLMADGTCVVLGSAANSDITAFDPAGAAAAVVAASVTESDTTHCPDGASVFTALAGKQASGAYLTEEVDPTAEPALGNPATTGWLLSSTDAGVRSWVAPPAGGGDLLADGTVPLTANWDVGAFTITAKGFEVPGTASGGQYSYALEDTDLGTNFLGWGVYGDVTASRIHIPPLADPTAGQVMAFAVPGNQTMGDTTSQPVTVGTWITPLTASDIDDTPSDGNTTQPASSNSVFDGLALKADIGHTVQYSQTPTIADPDTWTMSGNGMYGGQWIGTAAGIGALPAIAAGMNFTAKARGAYAVTLEPNGTEVIWLNGTSCTAGVNIVSSGTTGASAVCSYSAAGEWDCDGYLFACGS